MRTEYSKKYGMKRTFSNGDCITILPDGKTVVKKQAEVQEEKEAEEKKPKKTKGSKDE